MNQKIMAFQIIKMISPAESHITISWEVSLKQNLIKGNLISQPGLEKRTPHVKLRETAGLGQMGVLVHPLAHPAEH